MRGDEFHESQAQHAVPRQPEGIGGTGTINHNPGGNVGRCLTQRLAGSNLAARTLEAEEQPGRWVGHGEQLAQAIELLRQSRAAFGAAVVLEQEGETHPVLDPHAVAVRTRHLVHSWAHRQADHQVTSRRSRWLRASRKSAVKKPLQPTRC